MHKNITVVSVCTYNMLYVTFCDLLCIRYQVIFLVVDHRIYSCMYASWVGFNLQAFHVWCALFGIKDAYRCSSRSIAVHAQAG